MLRMQNIHLSYGSHVALRGVDFDLKPGEVHALIGEHRSGKTSLMRILAGEIKPDRGLIMIDDRVVAFGGPVDAVATGIGMVHQDLRIIPSLNSVDNIFVNQLPTFWLSFDTYGRYILKARRLLERLGMATIDLTLPTGRLPEAQQQVVELARLMALEPRIVILDEIAHRQNKTEMNRILEIVQQYREESKSIVYITPDINEVFEIADRVTVLTEGHRTTTDYVKNLDRIRLVRMAYNLAIDHTDDALPFAMRQLNETVIRDLPIGVLIFDEDERVFVANEAAHRICTTPGSNGLAGMSLEMVLRINAGDRHQEVLDAIRKNAKNVWEGVRFGSAEFTRVQTTTIRDDDMRIVGRVMLVQDATIDESVAEYLTRAEKMQSTAELAAGVAHEINNPLGTIRNYVEILKLRSTDEETTTRLDRISREMDRITDIVGSLLSFSKIRLSNRQRMDVSETMREVLTLLGHRFSEKELQVVVDLPETPIVVSADENRIKQVIVNILVNSIEATLDRDRIDISVSPTEDESVRISIRDCGSGIPEEVRDQVFQPFYSTKASKTNTGLGLSISKHIIEGHGGRITVDSRAGEYTYVCVYLPYEPSS